MNLLNKLYFVYQVFGFIEDKDEDSFVICKQHDCYLGCSKILGIFLYRREALKFLQQKQIEYLRNRCSKS